MPLEGDAQGITDYPLAKKGVNLRVRLQDVGPEEALKTTNCVWRDGIEKRGGYFKIDDDPVVADTAVTGLHRFYFGIGDKELLASAGTTVKYLTGGAWVDVKTGLSIENDPVLFETWGALDEVFMGNGNDAPFKWDGTGPAEAITGLTSTVIQFLTYQDRLLFISRGKPGELGWSNSNDDENWNFAIGTGGGASPEGATGVVPDTFLHGMVIHAARVAVQGIKAKVLLGGSNGMYIFSAVSLIAGLANPQYEVESLATEVGCISPLTMKWTPKGTMYVGTDKQVYILPFDAVTPIPIGQKITSSQLGRVEGLEVIPPSQMPFISAVYHEGYYKLSIPGRNGTFNSVQWWLDMDRMEIDDNRYFGPWYGPMQGMRFQAQIVQSGPGDNGEWLGGEANPGPIAGEIGGFVYQGATSGSFSDNGEDIAIDYQTFFNPLSAETMLDKVVDKLELEVSAETTTINVDYLDTIGKVGSPSVAMTIQSDVLWNELNWNTFNWASFSPARIRIAPVSNIKTRYLSINLKSSTLKAFRLYSIGANFEEQAVTFGLK